MVFDCTQKWASENTAFIVVAFQGMAEEVR